MLVVYSNEEEIIVCTKDSEEETIVRYFDGNNRDIRDYTRFEYHDGMVAITSQLYCY